MPFSSFNVKNSYPLSTHNVTFDHNNLYVRLSSNNSIVKTLALGGGIDMRIYQGNFQTGTIAGLSGSFNRTIDFNLENAGIIHDTAAGRIIGTSDTGDQGVTQHTYQIGSSNCPIRVIKNITSGIVTITCPCDAADCSNLNSSYQQVN